MLDRAVAAVSPERAVRRAAARKTLEVLNSGYGNYGANTTKKSMRGWVYHGGSALEDIENNLKTLRERSRDAYMGIPIATGALKTMRTNVIASGLVPTPQIDGEYLHLSAEQASTLQAQIVREWGLWADVPTCDADRVDNFCKLQQLAFMGFLMNGDSIALLPMKSQRGQPYDLRVRVIEADRVCSPNFFDMLTPGEVQGRHVESIVQGVETDADGMVVAYWICNKHPLSSTAINVKKDMEWTRVEAYGKATGRQNVLHVMARERAGQRRGVPILAPVLESLKQLGRYADAELDAAVISAMFTVFIKKDAPSDERPLGEVLPPDQLLDAQDQSSIELAPGAIVDLNPGESIENADPNRPNANFEGFFNTIVKEIAAALEIPSEVLFKQFSTSYSAARGALNEYWRTCGMQRDWFADSFCQPIYETWFAEAVAKGRIQAPGFFNDPAIARAYTNCTWNGPARTNLNPVQEVSAAEKRVQNGFSTAEQETAQMTGGSYAMNMRQRRIEAEQKKEVDDIATSEQQQTGGQPTEKQPGGKQQQE